jgi:hypothetical protein
VGEEVRTLLKLFVKKQECECADPVQLSICRWRAVYAVYAACMIGDLIHLSFLTSHVNVVLWTKHRPESAQTVDYVVLIDRDVVTSFSRKWFGPCERV